MTDPLPGPAVTGGSLLKAKDQATLAVLVALSLALLAAWWLAQGGPRQRLVAASQAPRTAPLFQVDVNTADWPELSLLPGVGRTLGQRIVKHRADHGPFTELEQLVEVNGIGSRTLERIRPFLLPPESR